MKREPIFNVPFGGKLDSHFQKQLRIRGYRAQNQWEGFSIVREWMEQGKGGGCEKIKNYPT